MPHLAVLACLGLAIEMEMVAGIRQQARHPVQMLAEKIVHLPASIGRGIAEAEAGQNPRQLRELACGTALDRPVV